MRPTFVTFLADALRLWRADWRVLTGVMGPFAFLPIFALMLFVEPELLRATKGIDPDDGKRLLQASFAAIQANMPWYMAAQIVMQFGSLVIMLLYLDRDRPDVGAALGRSLMLMPWYILATILASLIALPGMLLLVIGYFYLFARMSLVGPVMAAERVSSPFAAIGRSVVLTRGHGISITGAVVMVMLFGYVAQSPFNALDRVMMLQPPHAIVQAFVQAVAAGVTTLAALALVLLQVAAYRRLRAT